ncbi:MAG: murE [Haloplasmataceae bacterium]|jgi:UDP-N-acetylmuramoyl-L-alanyl-D-glutamate--2,6-diaminopimelate ligase|nr:murE [Haloplasmataceae bacterium]
MDLFDLLDQCNIYYDRNKHVNHVVNKIEDNSLNVCDNDLFIAIRGENNDGHNYIKNAVDKKAKTIIYEDKFYDYQNFENVNLIKVHDSKKALAVIANYFYDEPSKKLNLVGVTGTNGKTTVTTLIYNMYKILNEKCTLIGTTGIKINDKELDTNNTTPSVLILNQIFHETFENQINNCVMEVSSHAIKQQRVSQIDFDTVIFTNFSHDHLDYHKTVDDYFYSKGLLFAHLGNNYNNKKILLNGDDKYHKKFIRLSNVKYYTYGVYDHNDFRARNISCDIDSIAFDFYDHEKYVGSVSTKNIFGFFNVYNLLAIVAYFYINNYDMKQLFAKMNQLECVKGRMQKVENDMNLNVFIDYAHTPDSVYRILNEIKIISKRKIICVVGCGGNRDKFKRPIIGKIVTKLADYVIFTSDNPRYEDPNKIINDIVQGASNNNYICIENRSDAIKHAIDNVKPEDVILIVGKGHENYQIIKNKKLYFSDYDEVNKYIKMHS